MILPLLLECQTRQQRQQQQRQQQKQHQQRQQQPKQQQATTTSLSTTSPLPLVTTIAHGTGNKTTIIEEHENTTASTTESSTVINSTSRAPEITVPMEVDNDKNNDDLDESEVVELEPPSYPCPGSPNTLIYHEQMCNGLVDCPEATDEIGCTCRNRMDPSKICDGVFDCPSLDDETGCRGCNASQFNCDITRQRPLCIPLRQRCDGLEQCPDGMDEISCSILSPNEYSLEVSVAKYSSGYVMHNVKSKWYPLCGSSGNVTSLISGICQLTVGDGLGFNISKRKANSAVYKGQYAMMFDVAKRVRLVKNCSDLVFVECPSPRCGRKAPTQAEIGHRMTTKSNNATIATTTTKMPFQNVFFSNSSKTSGQSLQQAFETPRNLTDQPRVLERRLRRADFHCQSLGCSRLTGRYSHSKTQRRKRRGTLNRVVGGRESNMGAWPWAVAIIRDGVFKCGGSLLDSNWILSAAHCFPALEKSHFEIQLGMLRRSSYSPLEQTRAILSIYIHPNYNSHTLENDIALLRVQKPLQLNQWTAPACLPSFGYFPRNDTLCTVVGWGNVQENGPESDSLREVAVPIKPCSADLAARKDKILCAGYPEGKKDSCQGDSGGPFICPDPKIRDRWLLVGIVSFGLGCARPGELGAYTNVAYYVNWIAEVMDEKTVQLKRIPKQSCSGLICPRGTGACLTPDLICDGIIDCLNAEDELGCTTNLPPTSHEPIVTTISPNLTTTALPRPTVCSVDQFTCSKVFQCVQLSHKCNKVIDCIDGTDESSCSCGDYLKGIGNSELLCDNHVDCADFSDEAGCRTCRSDEYYSLASAQCTPYKEMCNNRVKNAQGDDESQCLALIPQYFSVALDRTGRPKREQSGLVAMNKLGVWNPICVQNWSSSVSDEICSFIGYGPGLSYSLLSGSKLLPLKPLEPPQGFLWNSSKPSQSPSTLFKSDLGLFSEDFNLTALHSIAKRQSVTSTTSDCKFVNVTCSNQLCGIRPNLGGWDTLPNTEGRFPWHATLFLEGQYLCGATLVAPQWLLVSSVCFRNIDLTKDYVAALLGSRRLIPFTSPMEQILRVANSVKISTTSKMTLLFLERPVKLTEHVNHVCLASSREAVRNLIKNQCVAVGMNGTLLASSASFSQIKLNVGRTLLATWTNNETISCPSDKWSGNVVCSDGFTWYAVAVFERDCSKREPYVNTLEGIWQNFDTIRETITCNQTNLKAIQRKKRQLQISCTMPVLPAPRCDSWRCPLGACLSKNETCDGIPNCRDRSDETEACRPAEKNELMPSVNSSICDESEYKCLDGQCIPGDALCDGVVDCAAGEDEKAPFSDLECPTDFFRCLSPGQNRSQETIPMSAVCDGAENCSNGMDESKCVSLSAEYPVIVDTNGNPLKLSPSGFVVVRVNGVWYLYCANLWSEKLTAGTCSVFGFGKRASFEAVGSSAFSPISKASQQCSLAVFLNCA
ncbi:serine protease nudel-like isoform X3 [Daphnia carinata]|uniref:serine protease nudel-like isoform X3 n=1 Tax=Daphnia carinata TaxID=120202 RepID=UPI002868C541|nr:serine protease nudel-like isoform X3 [Daphnia carinata]